MMVRLGPASPEELRANFRWCFSLALRGHMPVTETGLDPETIRALSDLARAAYQHRPTDELAAAAKAAFAAEMSEG